MNILDENIDSVARKRLLWLKVPFKHIGSDIGHSGMQDLNDVIPLLHSLKHPTFFTRDEDFYARTLVHAEYSLVTSMCHPVSQPITFIDSCVINIFERRPTESGKSFAFATGGSVILNRNITGRAV